MMPFWIIILLALELLAIGLLLGTAYRDWLDERLLERLILGEHRGRPAKIEPRRWVRRHLLGE